MRKVVQITTLATGVFLALALKGAEAGEYNAPPGLSDTQFAHVDGRQSNDALAESMPQFSFNYSQDGTRIWSDGAKGSQPRLIYAQWGPGGRRTVKCESEGGRYAYCRTYTSGRVRLEKQLSKTPCRQYETWGTDGDGSGVWVRDGCRGIFTVGRADWGGGDGGGGSGGTVTCKSEHFQYNHCPVSRGRGKVRLSRQLSDASCVRGSSWGVDRHGVWVDNGCAAEFTVR